MTIKTTYNADTSDTTKVRDIEKIKSFLTHMLMKLTDDLPRAQRTIKGPNRLYQLQTEMAYYINELDQGPECMQQVYIAEANALIDKLLIEQRARRQQTNSTPTKNKRRNRANK